MADIKNYQNDRNQWKSGERDEEIWKESQVEKNEVNVKKQNGFDGLDSVQLRRVMR